MSDVSSNELSGPEDGECESDKEIEETSPRKVLLGKPPSINSETIVQKVNPQPVQNPPPVTSESSSPPVELASVVSDSVACEDQNNVNNKVDVDKPAAVSDLEDISPERESNIEEDPSDPFADFEPEQTEEVASEQKGEAVKEPEFENFSPELPEFEKLPPEEPEQLNQEVPSELNNISEGLTSIQSPIRKLKKHKKDKKKFKKHKKDKRRTSKEECDLVGSPISSGPEDTLDSPDNIAASPISSGDEPFDPVITSPPCSDKSDFKLRPLEFRRGPRTPPAPVSGPRTPPAPLSGPRTPPQPSGPRTPPYTGGPRTPPVTGGPRTPPLAVGPRTPPPSALGPRTPPGPRTPIGPKTPPEPIGFHSPGSDNSNMSDRRYSKSKYHSDRSPDGDRRYDRRRSDTPEGQDARGLTPELGDRRRERSPPNNGNKRRRDSDWDSVEPKRRKSRDRSRDRKRERRSRDRSPAYRDRTPGRSPPYRDRSRSPALRDRSPARMGSDRKMPRSNRSRTRSRSRSPKRSDRPRKRDSSTLQDTSLFAEMRKKKHLRDKLEARSKVSKRDEFEDGIDNRKPPLPVEKGESLKNIAIAICYSLSLHNTIFVTVSSTPNSNHLNGSSVRLNTPEHPPPPPHVHKSRPKNLPGPPGGLEMNLDRGPQSPPSLPQKPPEKKLSKIMRLPLPPVDSDQNGDRANKKFKKPIVIDKVQVGPMTEDGRDWGERCVDMYKIVDKVTHYCSV